MSYIIILKNKMDDADTVQNTSKNFRQITRVVKTAELLALVSGFDEAYFFEKTSQKLTGLHFSIHAFVDSRTTFNCVSKDNKRWEKGFRLT